MSKNDPSKKVHTVVSRPSYRPPRTLTVTLPRISMPAIDWRQWLQAQKVFFLLIILLVALGGGLIGSWWAVRYYPGRVDMSSVTEPQSLLKSNTPLIASIAKAVNPSVVSINVVSTSTSNSSVNLFGITQPPVSQQSAGTGIIISSNGLVLTNRHVVPAGTTSVSITLDNGVTLNSVSVVGRTPPTDSLDIAILKINNTQGQKLVPAVIGNSDQVNVGDPVIAIGNALGQFQNTVTSGIISGFGRNISASAGGGNIFGSSSSENLSDMFQTDAAINEGNSGGPLLNLNGQVIGINTAIASNSQNIGFAIPINDVKGLIREVVKTGKFERPFLGVRFLPVTLPVVKQYKLSVNHGAYLAPGTSSAPAVVPGEPAAKAGLKAGEVIVRVNNQQVTLRDDLTSLIDQYEPGTVVTLKVVQGHKTANIKVKLGVEPNS